jgi:hypothetical protein
VYASVTQTEHSVIGTGWQIQQRWAACMWSMDLFDLTSPTKIRYGNCHPNFICSCTLPNGRQIMTVLMEITMPRQSVLGYHVDLNDLQDTRHFYQLLFIKTRLMYRSEGRSRSLERETAALFEMSSLPELICSCRCLYHCVICMYTSSFEHDVFAAKSNLSWITVMHSNFLQIGACRPFC